MTSQKVFPPLKGDRASDTIKGPSCEEGGKLLAQEKKGRLIIRVMANKTIGWCV